MCNWYTYASIAPSTLSLSLCLLLPRATTKNNECTRKFTPFIYEINVVVVVDVVIFAAQVRISSIFRSFITSKIKKWFSVDIIRRLRAMNGRIEIEIEIERKLSYLAKANNWETCSFVQLAQRVCVCVSSVVCYNLNMHRFTTDEIHFLSLSLLLVCLTGLANWKRNEK